MSEEAKVRHRGLIMKLYMLLSYKAEKNRGKRKERFCKNSETWKRYNRDVDRDSDESNIDESFDWIIETR